MKFLFLTLGAFVLLCPVRVEASAADAFLSFAKTCFKKRQKRASSSPPSPLMGEPIAETPVIAEVVPEPRPRAHIPLVGLFDKPQGVKADPEAKYESDAAEMLALAGIAVEPKATPSGDGRWYEVKKEGPHLLNRVAALLARRDPELKLNFNPALGDYDGMYFSKGKEIHLGLNVLLSTVDPERDLGWIPPGWHEVKHARLDQNRDAGKSFPFDGTLFAFDPSDGIERPRLPGSTQLSGSTSRVSVEELATYRLTALVIKRLLRRGDLSARERTKLELQSKETLEALNQIARAVMDQLARESAEGGKRKEPEFSKRDAGDRLGSSQDTHVGSLQVNRPDGRSLVLRIPFRAISKTGKGEPDASELAEAFQKKTDGMRSYAARQLEFSAKELGR